MSIRINIDNCDNPGELSEQKDGETVLDATTTCLGIYMVQVGIPQITASNLREVFDRIFTWQQVQGSGPFVKDGVNYRLTWAHIFRRIGMTVNAPTFKAEAWKTKLLQELRRVSEIAYLRQDSQNMLDLRGYLFGFRLGQIVQQIFTERNDECCDSCGSGVENAILADLDRRVTDMGPDDWTKICGPLAVPEVVTARHELRDLKVAYDLGTPLFTLWTRHQALVEARKAKDAK